MIVIGRRLAPFALAAALCPAAPAARAGDEPVVRILGAAYTAAAAETANGRSVSVRSTAALDPAAPTRILVRLAASRQGAPTRRIEAEGLSWRIDHREPRTTVTVALRVRRSGDPACPPGARGSLVARDDDTRLPGGRSSDSVRVRFANGKCRAFARAFTNARAGQRARVEVVLDLGRL